MADANQLRMAVSVARQRYRQVKAKYGELGPYLVFSSREGHAAIDASPLQLLDEFPVMVLDDAHKVKVLRLAADLRVLRGRQDSDVEKQRAVAGEIDRMEARLVAATEMLSYRDDIHVEVRFKTLRYAAIWRLKLEDVIDQELTMPSRASIRIVMGRLDRLCAAPAADAGG